MRIQRRDAENAEISAEKTENKLMEWKQADSVPPLVARLGERHEFNLVGTKVRSLRLSLRSLRLCVESHASSLKYSRSLEGLLE